MANLPRVIVKYAKRMLWTEILYPVAKIEVRVAKSTVSMILRRMKCTIPVMDKGVLA